jgi:hypothetical protein
MYQLCAMIAKETDHHRFLQLIRQLNDLLEHSQGADQEAGAPRRMT